MDAREIKQKDAEYWAVYRGAMHLQADCEKAGMEVQARHARQIRDQAFLRLVALHVANLTTPPDDVAA